MTEYAVLIEGGPPSNFSACVPDLPGCVATGDSMGSIRTNIRDAIRFHLQGMREDGDPIPEPSCIAIQVAV